MIKRRALLPLLFLLPLPGLHAFLAVTQPVKANVLVVEGWIPVESLKYAAHLYHTGHYDLVLTNGGEMLPRTEGANKKNYAESARDRLLGMGIDEKIIVAIRTDDITGSRTFSNAKSTVHWLTENKRSVKAINILTLDAHARKSRVLYKKAAGNRLDVGIISAPPIEYTPYLWFFSPYGIGFVLKNFAGYLYALFY